MSQRNPMNDRYQDGGPTGTSRKSAASAKPARPAADSVYEKKKPTTPQEKRKAQKAAQRAAEEKQRAEEKKAREEGRDPVKLRTQSMNLNPEYRYWRKWWWGLLVAAIVFTILSWVLQYSFTSVNEAGETVASPLSYVTLVLAYVSIIAAFVVDFKKIRKFRNAANDGVGKGNASPKQLKHEQETQQIEAARKAAKAAKRRKNPVVRTAVNATDSVKSKVAGASHKDADADSPAADEKPTDASPAADEKPTSGE